MTRQINNGRRMRCYRIPKEVCSLPFLLSVMLTLGCGGNAAQHNFPPPQTLNDIAGNWQFSATSSVSGISAFSFAGSMNQSGQTVASALHVNGSNCFDPLTTINLSGKQGEAKLSLSSTPVDGQVVTLVGALTNSNITATYAIKGGCADGDHGTVTGSKIPQIPGTLNGTFTTSTNNTFAAVVQAIEDSGNPDGTFGISGSATFSVPCFSSGTLKPDTFPSGSFVLGKSVLFDIHTNNGTVMFQGTTDQSTGNIDGYYTISGSTCNDSGTAVFSSSSPWDY